MKIILSILLLLFTKITIAQGKKEVFITSGATENLFYDALKDATVGTITFQTNITITQNNKKVSSNKILRFFNGNKLIVNSGVELIINGGIEAGLFQIFAGQGKISGNPIVKEIYPQWFGADASGGRDTTIEVQKAIDFASNLNGSIVYFPKGKYYISNLKISKNITILGEANHQIANIIPENGKKTGISLSDIPNTTILVHTLGTTKPLFDICNNVPISGIKISNLLFYQQHGNYTSNLKYPYIIDDTNSTSYQSGMTLEDCMFINTYNGVKLNKIERFHIEKINGDFFNNFLNVKTVRDVSRLVDIHIWDFSKSTKTVDYKRSTQSEYAIKVDDVDEIFMDRIYIWDRRYGIHLKRCWGKLSNYTADAVSKSLVIEDPKPFNFVGNNITINSSNKDEDVDAPITIIGRSDLYIKDINEEGRKGSGLVDVTLNNISIWYGGNEGLDYSYNSGILVNDPYTYLKITNANIKFAKKEGILIESAKYININGIYFTNYFPNQEVNKNTKKTVGIRNRSANTTIEVNSFYTDALRLMYDGYDKKLISSRKEALLRTN